MGRWVPFVGVLVRRLFSSFADGWPGIGLLIIRIVVGASLIVEGAEKFQVDLRVAAMVFCLLAIGDGALLLAGLWTPIAGSLVVVVAVWETLVRYERPHPGVLLAAMGAALALVGPGALSIDARLFGWKRIDLDG
jgi:putative oxidoreductase